MNVDIFQEVFKNYSNLQFGFAVAPPPLTR
jgi:hypothetical protein